jgi:uncharacterized protein (DUF1684 family)
MFLKASLMLRFCTLSFLLIILFSGSSCKRSTPLIEDEEAYRESIRQWQEQRLERLKGKTGWLNLAGLHWLEEGENSFGSAADNDIVFPEKAAAYCGTLTLEAGKVSLKAHPEAGITSEGVTVLQLDLIDDYSKPTTHLEQGDLAWYIIKRGEKYGIRLRDYRHPRIAELDQIPIYPVSLDYVVEATLVPFDEPKTMTVATPVEGFTETYHCPGELHFRLKGEKLVLHPFEAGKGYFLVLGDETSGMDTYGAGRFMYTIPDSTGRIILDFNRAYNPPCAFSPFATCPMPPRENLLAFPVEAGEKAVHLH